MTNLTQNSTERRQRYEICRLHSADVDNRNAHTHLGFRTPNNSRTNYPHSCSYFRFLHYLAMLEGKWARRQSNDGVLVQEAGTTVILLLDGRIMDTHHHIPVPTGCRKCPDRNSSRVLGSAIEQSYGIETVTQKGLCVG